jgi:hypothetical protein
MSVIAPVKLSSILASVGLTTSATIGFDTTFNPEGFRTPGVARWVDRSLGIAIGYPALTLAVRPPTKVSRIYRVSAKLVLPTLDITSPATGTGIQPAPSVGFSDQCMIEFLLSERGTNAGRLKLLSLVHSLFFATITASDAVPSDLTGSPLTAAVADFDPPYG